MWFENFYEDMGKRPEGMSIDRIDVNGNYCPENCRWASFEEQCRNKRDNKFISYKGQTKIISDWAKDLNISKQTLHKRLKDYNYSVDEAFNLKLHHNKSINFSGEKNPMSKLDAIQVKEIKILIKEGKKITELSKIYGISNSVISNIKSGKRWGHVEV
jgi:transposase